MKCRKCGAEIPYSSAGMGIRSSSNNLCKVCVAGTEASGNNEAMGCLYVVLGIIALVGIMAFVWRDLSFSQFLGHFLLLLFAVFLLLGIWAIRVDSRNRSNLNPEEREEFDRSRLLGPIRSQIVCVHCQVRGGVRTKRIQKDAGISGKKASAAALTGGISILATGLSRKETVTQAHCDNCGSTWTF